MPTITYATLGAKGQIVIPKEARDKLHVGPGDRVVLIIEDGKVMMINPDGVQHMIKILQEGMETEVKDKKTKKNKKDSPERLEKDSEKSEKQKNEKKRK